jgi:tricorn protease
MKSVRPLASLLQGSFIMSRLITFVFALFVLLGTAFPLGASEPIQFARTPDISPDGKLVAFSYLGDLWVVDSLGGVARHLTMHEKHDYEPIFSPDGASIAFSSNRHGSYDVFVVPVEGGKPARLTHDSAEDHVTGWSPDGKQVLFASSRQTDFPARVEMFVVPVKGGQARQVSAFEGREGAFSPRGDMIAYVRGPGTWFRKGYRGSANDDIWISSADGTNNRQLTSHAGQDNWPTWSPDGRYIYYVSDCLGGPANVVRQEIDPQRGTPVPGKDPERVTDHKDERVRRARLNASGEWLVYECGADIWVHSLKDKVGRKLHIEVNADDRANMEKMTTFTSGATEFALSHDEKHIAFVVHGEIFLMPRAGGKARRLTNSPAFDHGVAWSPDSKKILFLSDRSGFEDIYLLEPDDPDHPELTSAHRFKVKQLTHTPEAEIGVSFSPDGSKVAFLRAGKLITMNPDGTGEKILVGQGQVFDYEWSPDGKWLCYARMDGSFASELYIIPSGGPTPQDPPRNVTRFATYNGGVTWSKSGNKLAFISQRVQTTPSAYVLSLQKPSAAGASASKDIDWDNIHLRVKQPSPLTISECAISGDGSKIAFRATQDNQSDLWVASSDGGQVMRLTSGDTRPAQIHWSRLFPSQIYFRDGGGNIRTAFLGGGPPGSAGTVSFQAKMVVRQDEVFAEIFDQGWRALNDSFYDPQFHGANWGAIREKYRALVKHCAMKEDLYALISIMLGELNASHLGITGNLGTPDQETADLGLVFDRTYAGAGLKITDVVRGGPADRRGVNVRPGDLLLAIDGEAINSKTDTASLLNDKVGEAIVLTISSDPSDPSAKRRIEVQGGKRAAIFNLRHEQWVERNARRVAQLSQDKLGYIHISAMDEPGLLRFVRSLYSDNFDKEGLVLDVRFNGGGFTHDKILNYLNGKEHTIFAHRDGGYGLVLNSFDRKWTRPLVLLINNRSYSDAEIFPHAFRSYGLGKLVGQKTGGHVIGTRNIQLIDGSAFRTPRIGVHTIKGVNMEKEGVVPDIEVAAHPDQLARGEDPQLDRAVAALLEDVIAWRKTHPLAAFPQPGSSPNPGVGPSGPPAPPPMPMSPPKE